jgi:hypothetical protein
MNERIIYGNEWCCEDGTLGGHIAIAEMKNETETLYIPDWWADSSCMFGGVFDESGHKYITWRDMLVSQKEMEELAETGGIVDGLDYDESKNSWILHQKDLYEFYQSV